tara:strand:- start:1505 stop:2080 length:576 start_codon:yes stop_codon:yes gene_type:complete
MKNSNSKFNNFKFSSKSNKEIKNILSKYPSNRKESGVLPILDLAQRDCGGWLPMEVIEKVAELIGMPQIRVLEIASFYSMFNLKPVGKYHLQLCSTTPCWLRGSDDILRAIKDELKLNLGDTSDDGLFTLTKVECLGACVNAPILQVNDDFYEDLDYSSSIQILKNFKSGKNNKVGSVKNRSSEPENITNS